MQKRLYVIQLLQCNTILSLLFQFSWVQLFSSFLPPQQHHHHPPARTLQGHNIGHTSSKASSTSSQSFGRNYFHADFLS